MQEKVRRSNADRRQATREALVRAGRELFVRTGYAATGTPEIVAAAQVTRGALYHHFEDKADLFEAIIRQDATEVAEAIGRRTEGVGDALEALHIGTEAFLDAMAEPGRTRLLLIEGPAVLGTEKMKRIDREISGATLVDGLAEAVGRAVDGRLEAQASLLAAAFDRAALEISQGGDREIYRALLRSMSSDAVRALRAEADDVTD